jgi:hypothetical protein
VQFVTGSFTGLYLPRPSPWKAHETFACKIYLGPNPAGPVTTASSRGRGRIWEEVSATLRCPASLGFFSLFSRPVPPGPCRRRPPSLPHSSHLRSALQLSVASLLSSTSICF